MTKKAAKKTAAKKAPAKKKKAVTKARPRPKYEIVQLESESLSIPHREELQGAIDAHAGSGFQLVSVVVCDGGTRKTMVAFMQRQADGS